MRIKLDEGAKMPTRAHAWDAGIDLYAREDQMIAPNSGKVFDTGVHMEIPRGMVGFLKSRSGLNVWEDLTNTGVIDADYTGSICVKLYNHGSKLRYIKAGERIAQIVILPCHFPVLELVDELEDTERGVNGFGSSGR